MAAPTQNVIQVKPPEMLRVAVVGAGGYSGVELVNLLLNHPRVKVVGLFGSEKRKTEGDETAEALSSICPRFRGRLDLAVRATDINEIERLRSDAIFLATPHEVSVRLAPDLMKSQACVLDLSAAFRFPEPAMYGKHYGFEHPHPGLLRMAVYGLPELNRAKLPGASLIAVPGCYPTSVILALAPLVRAGAIAVDSIGAMVRPIIDSTSGVSGAGRSLKLCSLFCEVSLQPYSVFKHRHNPEIDLYSGVSTIFTPHLAAFERGILSTIHVHLSEGWDGAKVSETLLRAYDAEPFVRLCPAGVWPAVADVRHTNFCDIGWEVEPKERGGSHLILVSAIDNLMKGAAGQAVQAMNARFGYPEVLGLLNLPSKEPQP